MATLQSALFEDIESEICEGNPVIVQLDAPSGSSGMHFVLATGVTRDRFGVKTFIVNDPGNPVEQNIQLSGIAKYPFITGYRRYKPARDPAMIFGHGSGNIHFIITDPMGRRVGFDPINRIGYSEIPKAQYYLESYNTPIEDGVSFETLTQQNVFEQTQDVMDGNYEVRVYGVTSGNYMFKMTSHDVDGEKNNESDFSGAITAGEVKIFGYKHSSSALPNFNAQVKISQLLYSDISLFKIKPMALLTGQMVLNSGEEISLGDSVQISLGSPGDFTRVISASHFKVKKVGKSKEFYFEFNKDEKLIISSDGKFFIQIRGQEIVDIPDNKKQNIFVRIGNKSAFKKVELKCNRNICVKK